MDTVASSTPFEDDGRPFVIEACGDDMWDEVLAQPPYNPALRSTLPLFTHDRVLQNSQVAKDVLNSKDPV